MQHTTCRLREDADGIRLWFECPGCGQVHSPYISGDQSKHPVWRWNKETEKPTLYPSVRVRSYFAKIETICHFHLVDGQLQFIGDCTHKLAGKTVAMIPWTKNHWI